MEEEEPVDLAELKLNQVMLFTTVNMVLDFLFYGMAKIVLDNDLAYLSVMLGFVFSLLLLVVIQQKTVDLVKKINPEKKGSVYEFKFKNKWLESCDENEKRIIGEASFKAVTVVCTGSVVMWLLLFFAGEFFNFGILPVILVCFFWGLTQISYCISCIKMSKH